MCSLGKMFLPTRDCDSWEVWAQVQMCRKEETPDEVLDVRGAQCCVVDGSAPRMN